MEASTVVTTEYDKSGNAIRQVSVSNINDLGSGGDGSVLSVPRPPPRTTRRITLCSRSRNSTRTATARSNCVQTHDLRERRARQRPADRARSGPGRRRIGGHSIHHHRDVRPTRPPARRGDRRPTTTPMAYWTPAPTRRRRTTRTATWSSRRRSSTIGADGTIDATSHDLATYDDGGHMLSFLSEVDDDGDGALSSRGTGTFTYSSQGELLEQVFETDQAEFPGGEHRWSHRLPSDGHVRVRRAMATWCGRCRLLSRQASRHRPRSHSRRTTRAGTS